jgi:SAM-dependent methyltransferase
MMTIDEAVLHLRSLPEWRDVLHTGYLTEDVVECADRFHGSTEFAEVLSLLGDCVRSGAILDLGAGTGIASSAFARSGARVVYALEPDPSELVGRGAIRKLSLGLPIEVIDAWGETLPLPDESVEVVYARQVLHHVRDLRRVISECARVLKPGGVFLACREHVVSNDQQLRVFLEEHPMHQLAGSENAYPIERYLDAFRLAGLRSDRVVGPWDSVINSYPSARTVEELRGMPRTVLRERWGQVGLWLSLVPGMSALVWQRIRRYEQPGRLYTFLARKPGVES